MKIIDVETDDIGTFKSIIEILQNTVPEANAEFIKDIRVFNQSLDKKKKNDTNEDIENSDEQTKKVSKKQSKNEKVVKKNKEESDNEDEDDDEDKKKQLKKNKKPKNKNDDTQDAEEENMGMIKILTADPNQVMLIYITLKGSQFKKFYVQPDVYSVGLNLDELYKYIKNADKEGTLSIRLDSDDTQHIIFDVSSANTASNESICELRLINLPSRHERKIEMDFSLVVRMNCQAFHKACKDLLQFSQFVEITCDPSQLAITCKGDLSNHKRIFRVDGSNGDIAIKTIKRGKQNDEPDIVRLVFDLKYINSMYKCSSLCEYVEIYLNSDSIMFLKYTIKVMGEMIVGISPSRKKKEQTENNYNEEDDTFYNNDDEIILR